MTATRISRDYYRKPDTDNITLQVTEKTSLARRKTRTCIGIVITAKAVPMDT